MFVGGVCGDVGGGGEHPVHSPDWVTVITRVRCVWGGGGEVLLNVQ